MANWPGQRRGGWQRLALRRWASSRRAGRVWNQSMATRQPWRCTRKNWSQPSRLLAHRACSAALATCRCSRPAAADPRRRLHGGPGGRPGIPRYQRAVPHAVGPRRVPPQPAARQRRPAARRDGPAGTGAVGEEGRGRYEVGPGKAGHASVHTAQMPQAIQTRAAPRQPCTALPHHFWSLQNWSSTPYLTGRAWKLACCPRRSWGWWARSAPPALQRGGATSRRQRSCWTA